MPTDPVDPRGFTLAVTPLGKSYDPVGEERAALRSWLSEDFDGEADALMALCCHPKTGRPLYFSHVALAEDLANSEDLDVGTRERITRAYIYLVACYYILDAITDGHPCHSSDLGPSDLAAYLLLLGGRAAALFKEIEREHAHAPASSHRLSEALVAHLRALRLERDRASKRVSWDDERPHMWGRSNCFLYLLEFIAALKRYPISRDALEEVRDLLLLIQRGDDSCDWRQDHLNGSTTPFLRIAYGGDDPAHLTVEDVERRIYLQRLMDTELRHLSGAFERTRAAMETHGMAGLAKLAADQRDRARAKQEAFAEVWRDNSQRKKG